LTAPARELKQGAVVLREYEGDDPKLIGALATSSKDVSITTVVHSAVDDLNNPKRISDKFHRYDSHIGELERNIDDLKYELQ
jgi:hypothetical protein